MEFVENGISLNAKDLCLVINVPIGQGYKSFEKNNIVAFNDFLETNGYIFYMIKHDLDILENGELKRLHFHYVILSPRRRRLKTFLLEFSCAFGCNMPINCISIARCVNVDLAIQYLIHKNNKEKFLYDEDNILSNDIDYKAILNKEVRNDISAKYLEDLIVNKKLNDIEIADLLGANKFLHYLPLIKAIKQINHIY